MKLPQAFANRENHLFKILVYSIFPLLEKDTALKFFLQSVVGDAMEEEWFNRDVYFDEVIMQAGSRKQDYPILTYQSEIKGGTYKSTGYGMAIPFMKLIKNGTKGRYSIDRFLIEGMVKIALAFKMFLYHMFFENVYMIENQYLKSVKRTGKTFETFDDFVEFYESIFGILNVEGLKDNSFPVEHLIQKARNLMKVYNGGIEKKIGIILDEGIIFDERYKKYNSKFSYVGPKTGTFRNTDNLDEKDDVWKTNHWDATIFGINRFRSREKPNGFSPVSTTIEQCYWILFPSIEDIIDEEHYERYKIKHHDVKAIDTTNWPINYNYIKFKSVIDNINKNNLTQLFGEHTELNGFIKENFVKGGESYMNIIFNIIMSKGWEIYGKDKGLNWINYALQALDDDTTIENLAKHFERIMLRLGYVKKAEENIIGDVQENIKDIDKLKKQFIDRFTKIPIERGNDKLKKMIGNFIGSGLPPPFKVVLLRFENLTSYCAILGTENVGKKLRIQPTAITTFNPDHMEAQVTFKDNLAIRIDNHQDIMVLENVKIMPKLGGGISCKLSEMEKSQYHILLFPYKAELDKIKRLFYKSWDGNFKGNLQIFLRDFESFKKIHKDQTYIKEYTYTLKDKDMYQYIRPWEHYLGPKTQKYCHFAYKGGYYTFSHEDGGWTHKVPLHGPMGKIYNKHMMKHKY
jgi:hypothetical protein